MKQPRSIRKMEGCKTNSTYWFKQSVALTAALALCGPGATAQREASLQARERSDPSNLERLLASRPVVNQTLTMDAAVDIALRESPVVRGAAEGVQAAMGRLSAARSETRPWISANTFASVGSNSNIVAGPGSAQPQMIMALPRDAYFDQNIMLMIPLFTGGRLSAMIRQAAAIRNASQADLAAQRADIALMTRLAYREALARRALVTVGQARLTENQERLRVDQNRFQAGAVPALTVQRDEAEEAAARQDVTNAQRDVDIALVNLKTAMGIHPGSRIELSDADGYEPSTDFIRRLTAQASTRDMQTAAAASPGTTLPADLSALLRLAERRRPELQAASERVQGARAETSAARSAFLPQVNLFAMGDFQASRGSNGFVGTTFGVAASLPLYNGGGRRARVQTADAERRRQQQEQERSALLVAQEVSTALLNLRAAEQNIQTGQKARTAGQESYRVALQRYEAGRSTNVEVLDALATRTQAESSVVQALFQYGAAHDQLLHAVGVMGTSSIGEDSAPLRRR